MAVGKSAIQTELNFPWFHDETSGGMTQHYYTVTMVGFNLTKALLRYRDTSCLLSASKNPKLNAI